MGLEKNTYRQYFDTKEEADAILEKLCRKGEQLGDDQVYLADLLDLSGKEPSQASTKRKITSVKHACVEKITTYVKDRERTQYTIKVHVYTA